MFEKKKKKQTLLDSIPSSYEDISDEPKRWPYGNTIYAAYTNRLYRINSAGVMSEMDTNEFYMSVGKETLKELLFTQKMKLFIDHDFKKEDSKENKLQWD